MYGIPAHVGNQVRLRACACVAANLCSADDWYECRSLAFFCLHVNVSGESCGATKQVAAL